MLARRRLGSTDLSVSPLGLACNFGIDAGVVESALHDHGINYFFVTSRADAGVDGVKKLIAAGHRNEIVIATGANVPFGWSVRREWEKSARSLGVDCIDVFHLFWVQSHWYVTGNTWREMVKLKEEGKVRALAVSCHDRPLASRLVSELALDVLMIRYNAAHRGAESEIFSNFSDPKPAVVAYTATRWGRLLKPAAGLDPMTPPECYRFAISNPNVDLVLCGPKSKDELVQDSAGVELGPLPGERLEAVCRFGDAVRSSVTGKIGFGAA